MAKRGETKPWKMTYLWPSGIKGTVAFGSETQARDAADRQAAIIGPDGESRCTVEVFYRPAKVGAR